MKMSNGQGPLRTSNRPDKDKIKSTVSHESEVPLKMYVGSTSLSHSFSDHIQFGMLSGTEMRNLSEIRIFNAHPYHLPTKVPVEYGPLDPRLVSIVPIQFFSDQQGVSGKDGKKCTTCGKLFAECAGRVRSKNDSSQ